MNNKSEYSGKGNGYTLNGRSTIFVACVSAIIGGISGPFLLVQLGGDSVVAPDRYTGTQATALTNRVAELEEELGEHKDFHPDRDLDRRITVMEAHYADILRHLQRIEDQFQ